MISDVLSDAIAEIERYEHEMPNVYGDPAMRMTIEHVKATMLALQRELDIPPGGPAAAGVSYPIPPAALVRH